jgi:succinate-acetate transporter protein
MFWVYTDGGRDREMAVGNTFGATALTSYGGFWIGLGIIFTPGGFEIASAYGGATTSFYTAVGFYLYVRSPSHPFQRIF